jgi:small-conductance mechanosensitive channel
MLALALDFVLPALQMPPRWHALLSHAVGVLVIASGSWLLVALTFVVSDLMLARYDIHGAEAARARTIRTQIEIFRRVFLVAITVLAGSLILMSFSWGRDLGESMLASAGIAGIAVGLAARPALENVVAGIQLGLTQPIEIEDAVIVENDWGWIEEIGATYVVVRTWDLRRLILPLTYFIQHPFQNWTRTSPDLIGIILLYLDYSAPIEAIRKEFTRLVQASSRWDKNVCVLQVTDATEHSLQIRGLASAADAGTAWDLRCEVREKLVEFIQRNYPHCLPKMRAELPSGDGAWAPDGPRAQAPPRSAK